MRATTDSFKGDIAMQFVKFQAQKKELKAPFLVIKFLAT
ncbi:polynucleotide phosphorylase/polyadenylase [Alteromonadales bacterium TW-7]|nr:polynucleotide phosphorylase/polyadenylase [Alteromonadales bacterium TW-7]